MTHGTTSSMAATAFVAVSCFASCDGFYVSSGFAPAALRSVHTSMPARPAHPINAAVHMDMSRNSEGRVKSLANFLGRVSRGAVAGAALALSVAMPRAANANVAAAEPALSEADLAGDEAITLYEPIPIKKAITLETFGVAAGAAAATLGGATYLAVKKEKGVLGEEVDAFERELERMEQFKKEFLDGEVSDRSLFASFSKAVKNKLPSEAASTSEDEFEKNVQAFLDEQNEDKKPKKPKSEWAVGKGGPSLLERPDDIDGSKADEWLQEIGYEDKPAEINQDQLAALQRMLGGGDAPAAK